MFAHLEHHYTASAVFFLAHFFESVKKGGKTGRQTGKVRVYALAQRKPVDLTAGHEALYEGNSLLCIIDVEGWLVSLGYNKLTHILAPMKEFFAVLPQISYFARSG